MKALLIVNDAPYGIERTYNALRVAGALSKREGVELKVFLMETARWLLRPGRRCQPVTTVRKRGHTRQAWRRYRCLWNVYGRARNGIGPTGPRCASQHAGRPDRLDRLGGEGGELLIGRRAAGRGCAQPCEQNTL